MHKAQKCEGHIKALLPCLLVPVATIAGSCHHWECSEIIFKSKAIEDPQGKKKNRISYLFVCIKFDISLTVLHLYCGIFYFS